MYALVGPGEDVLLRGIVSWALLVMIIATSYYFILLAGCGRGCRCPLCPKSRPMRFGRVGPTWTLRVMTGQDSLHNSDSYEESSARSTSGDGRPSRSSPLGQQPGGDGMYGVGVSWGVVGRCVGRSSGAYSTLAHRPADRVVGIGRLGAAVLSNSQSTTRVMNPRARKGVAVRTLLITMSGGWLERAGVPSHPRVLNGSSFDPPATTLRRSRC